MKKISTLFLLGLMLQPLAQANETHQAIPWSSEHWNTTLRSMPQGDVDRGQKLANAGYCYSCHGVAGVNPTVATPSLAGQNAVYTYKMLKDYQSGLFNVDRKSDVMMALAKTYSDQDFADMAAYYEAQELPQGIYPADANLVTPAVVKLVKKGDFSRMITPCASCHGVKGEGGRNETPAITGLSPRMFERQMLKYHSGERHNDVHQGMAQFAQPLTTEEIRGLAAYYATLK